MPQMEPDRETLKNMRPNHTAFVGVDSDGCVFDTMDIKQKQCFHGQIVAQWRLEPIERLVRETAEFVNLHSKSRGRNRFLCLVETMDRLRRRPEAIASDAPIPALTDLKAFIASGAALGHPALEQAARETGSAELAAVLDWSLQVNAAIEATVKNVPPFPWARECLELMGKSADLVCVSQTPYEALAREWAENGLQSAVRAIAGQELGTKSEHIALATSGRYAPDRILMIGDAPGDRKAARDNGALFYPIVPAREAESWERLYREGFERFLAGSFAGDYEERLAAAFDAALPDIPPWTETN